MKKSFRRVLSLILCLIMVVGAAPTGILSTEASAINTTYCATAAAQWAKDHVYDYDSVLLGTGYYNNGGDCANFVSQCLYMGGMDMSGYWNTNGYLAHWTEPYGYDYAGSFIRCVQLSNYLKSMGASVIRDPKASQVEIGDVILFYRSAVGSLGHSCIVIDIVNGVPVVAAHSVVGRSSCYKSTDSGYNNDWHLGFSGSNTYLYKMNGSKCVNNNPRSFDVYTASGSPYLYSSPSTSSSQLTQYISGEYTHIYQTQNGWGKTFRYGKWGWVKLSSFNYRTHIQSAPVDHIWGNWQVVTVANCQQDGLSERFCQRCGLRQEQVTKGGHITDPHAWCTSEGYCKICGVKTENALGHKWDAGKVTKKPTCLEEGVMTYTCTRDKSHTYTEPIPALGHDFNAVVSLPNCTTTGTTQNKCSRCGYMTTVRNGNIWSEWTTDDKAIADPPAGYTYKESSTQYRYRDKQTTTSGSSSLDGWTQYDKVRTGWGSTQGPVYSNPSNSARNVWSEQYISGYNKKSVDVYYRWHPSNEYYYSARLQGTYDGYSCTVYEEFTSGVYKDGNNYKATTNSGGWVYVYYGRTDQVDDTNSPIYSTRWYYQEPVYTYYYYRWLDWSSWGFTKYNKSDSREVQTRTVYRYNLAALGHNFTINVTNEFLQRDKLLSASQAAGTCYSTGKKCSRCGTVSPDAVNVKHSFTQWSNLSSTEQISYCDNGCGCYITKSTKCSHDWIKQSVVDPHCTSDGYTNYKCSKCGATKKDDALTALGHENSEEWVITKPATCTDSGIETAKCVRHDNGKTCSKTWTREIPALGHTMTKFEANEMTCTKDGNTEYYYCSTCDKYFADENGTTEIKKDSWVIEATGHKAGGWIVEHPKGCGVTGWECKYCVNEWCDEHTECKENADHGAHGFLMDEREIDEITPDYYVCRFEDAAYDSSKDEWVSTTCCHGGIIYITCRNCEGTDHAHGDIPGDCPESAYVLDPLDHNWGGYIYEKASCVHSGFKYKICQSCETENCECCVYDKEVIDAPRTEHQYILAEEIATECTAGTPMQHWVCAICGQTECDTCAANEMPHHYWTGDPQKHELVLDPERSWEATCVDEGNNHYKCAKCEYCYDEAIEPKGHKMALSNTIEPSCLEEGFEVWTCSVCGFNEKRNTTPALGHLETSPFTVTKKGTCVSNGLEEQFCARVANGQTCGVKLDEKIILARGHNMGEWYDDPDATAEGETLCRKRDCLNTTGTDKYEACDYTETEAHKWGPWIYDGEEAKTHTKTCEYNNKETITVSCTFESKVTKKATCTEDGVRTFTCAVCGGQYTEIIPARKHNWGEWYVTVPATLTTEGEERRDCTNSTEEIEYEACDCYETRVTEVTGADYQVLIYEMDASGTYQLISNKTYRDLIGKYVEVSYDTTTGFTFNREKSVYTGIIEKDGSLVLSLFIDRNVHTVTFNFDNGEKPDFRSLYYGANINMPDDPEKVGYEFVGWSADGKTVSVVPKTVPDRDLEYTALWKAKNYTITYNYEGGKKEVTYPYTAVINEYNPPEREGYSFTGWDPVLPGNMPANNLETTATYARNAYNITYYIDGEQYGDVVTYQFDDEVAPVVPDAKTGYDFSGWSPAEPINMPAKNLELYGEWKPASGIQYKIETYLMNLDGNYDLYKTETHHGITGQDVAAVDTTGEGFTLNEEKSILSGKILPDGSLVLKVYIDRNIHKISFDDGTNKTAEDLYFGDSIAAPKDPEKEGYTFKGWSEDGEKVDTVLTTVPDRDVAYKAIWEINQYAITFTYGSVNGGLVYEKITQDYGTTVTKPADPTFTGYTFIDWDKAVPSDMPAKNIEINALWNVNEHKVTWVVKDKRTVVTYNYGQEIIKPADPSFDGEIFIGWNEEIPETMPDYDLEFYAGFEAITHKAIFVVADENGTYSDETGTYKVVETVEFKEGQQSLPEPAVPEKEGYTGDWEEYALGKNDVVIKAVYELIDSGNTDKPEEKKSAEDNGDGTVTITLDTFAKAKNILIKGENEPIDIILVVDQSGSMEFNMGNNNIAKVGQRRRDYLVKTATSFIESVKENAVSTGADHRISIVGFGMGSKGTNTSEGYFDAYLNTAVLTTVNDSPVAYNEATSDIYRDSLMSVINDYSHISAAVDNIAYKGATAADLGFDMALQVVNANESDRKTVVIFLTDGEPTTFNGFEDGVAKSAIDKAKKLKDGGATVYSVAISDLANPKDCTENFNKFLHATSSNFKSASSLNILGNGDLAGGYFVSVKDSNALQKIFDNIYVRSVAKTVNFNSVTVYDTITSDFTMTAVQEDEFRRNVIETYGVTNNDITVNRRDDGTTYLEIRNLSPKKRYDSTNVMLGWGVTVSFTVTANENALDAGEYISNTDKAGVIIGGFEAGKFLPAEVELKTNRYIVEYFIGDEIYDIQVGDEGDQITAPDVPYASWTISDDALITDRVAKYTASLGDADRKATWNIDGKSVEESYATGQRIVAPEVNIPGKVFIGWSPTVETHMGWFDLEYTALFSTHTHSYKVTESGLCTEGITYTYTCECGDSYSEKQAPKEHRLEAVVYQTETETITHFNCNDCKYNYQRTLTFKVISSYGKETKLSLNLLNKDGVSIHKDDDKDYYYVKLPIQSLDSNSRRLVNAGKRISVVHYISADEREYCDYDVSGEYIVIHCPSFSYYVISGNPADSNTSTYDEITCDLEGHKYDWIYNGDATYKNNGTETQVCSVCGAKGITRDKENSMLKDPFTNVVINVANGTVDYRTIVTLKASADNVPADFYLAIFDGDKLLVKGDNESVTLSIGEMKDTKAYTVRVVNENGETQRDANGKKLEAESTITVKGNFFKKIIAFFRWLFRSLPQVTIEPKK